MERKCKNTIGQYPRRVTKNCKTNINNIIEYGIKTECEIMMMKPLKNMINDMEICISNTTCIKWHILQLICPYWKYKTI